MPPKENVMSGRSEAANDALREIAGRLKRLSYLDMIALADAFDLPVQNVLHAADVLEKA
jgi:crotonobetainyl-CoA:carnitine CoA-transferase CaiB-like acyl-CoA transferase